MKNKVLFSLLLLSVLALACALSVADIEEGKDTRDELDFAYLPLSGDSKTLRGMDNVVVTEPTFIPFGNAQTRPDTSNSFQVAAQFVHRRLDKFKSRFLLYPYAFDKTVNGTRYVYPEGAIISTSPDGLPSTAGSSWFAHVTQDSNLDLRFSQALYDTSIAVLQVNGYFMGEDRDLTLGGVRYCPPFVTYIGQHYTQCFESKAAYEKYLADHPLDHEDASVVFITPEDIRDDYLQLNGVNRFGMLVIPDIFTGAEAVIIQQLNAVAALPKIRTFVQDGGVVYASAKGAYVVERLGVDIPETTFSNTHCIVPETSSGAINVRVRGCENIAAANETSNYSWVKRMMCFGQRTDGVLPTDMMKTVPIVDYVGTLEVLSSWVPNHRVLHRKSLSTGIIEEAVVPADASLPHILYKPYGHGHVIINTGASEDDWRYYQWLYDAMYVAMSRPMIVDNKLSQVGNFTVIPALEQISLAFDIDMKNMYKVSVPVTKFDIFIAKGVKVDLAPPPECVPYTTSLVPPLASLQSDYHLSCVPTGGVIESFKQWSLRLPLFIEDVLVTQPQHGCVLAYIDIDYTWFGETQNLNYGAVTVDAAMAALIRTDANPDPVGHYPVFGRGQYIDTVIWAENKEETVANDVVHVSIVPLISPLVDGSNQGMIVHPLDWDHLYYKKSVNGHAEYKYPFDTCPKSALDPAKRDYDYLDFRLLGHRHNFLVADWDTPVKTFKETRADVEGLDQALDFINVDDVPNASYGTNVDKDDIALRQDWFPDSDTFYEHATQRLLAMLDTTEEGPFATYNDVSSFIEYQNKMCPDWKFNNTNGLKNKLKMNLLFTRNDFYFYDNGDQYPLPDGVTSPYAAFTIDRYSPLFDGECVSGWGASRAQKLVPGYFNSTNTGSTGNPPGMKPHEYSNELLMNCDRYNNRISWETLADKTNGQVTKTHYLMRINDNPVHAPTEALYFVQDTTYPEEYYYSPSSFSEPDYARFGSYPEVRMVYVAAASFPMSPAITRKGGKMIFTLPAEVNWQARVGGDPVGKQAITVAADQVAVTEITISTDLHVITVWFKRGNMPNENYGKDSAMEVNLQWLTDYADGFVARLDIEELVYDFNEVTGPKPFETYRPVKTITDLAFNKQLALDLPALRMEYKLRRGDNGTESFMQPYEYLEPFVRTGVYMQELMARRTVWGSAEVHQISDTGLIAKSGGFMWLSNIGINSIPFREYLQTGSKQVIPAAVETGRIEWKDIWNRKWSQPIRSVYVDVPPIPPPIRNFMMTTTFEILSGTGSSQKRVLQWTSDEPVIVRAHVKLLNNYPKWFEITNCKENQVVQKGRARSRVFGSDTFNEYTGTETDHWLQLGYEASYGSCFANPDVYLEAKLLNDTARNWIIQAQHCAGNGTYYAGCQNLAGLPTVTKRKAASMKRTVVEDFAGQNTRGVPTDVWNYAKQVEDHWPTNYIKPNMWDMTHYDYDDTPFDKAYKYHMDNNLPSLDKTQEWPHNIIAFPLFKGLGYSMTYDKTLSISTPGLSAYKGWWSDNLQNRDSTLVAGQAVSNDVSVGRPDLISPTEWIDIYNLKDLPAADLERAVSNQYVCLFNRYRPKVDPTSSKISHVQNVYQNNIVPIDPTLDKFDARLFNFKCNSSIPQYTPLTISQAPNYVATQTSRDWLYFAANLRGGAKETINVLYRMTPLANGRREGVTKVQDGGRFTYWNPCCGPNAFLIVDNPAQTAIATRTDLTLAQEVFPVYTLTYNSYVYQLVTLQDKDEINREYTLPIYYNYHGFGDAAVSVYVGGVRGTRSLLNPGDVTYVKVEFQNNAGFDWNLYANAISFEYRGSTPINANDLLFRLVHSIQAPLAYNFMRLRVPPEIAPYLNVTCSDHNIATAPLFFDFENINVATIRDGFKGVYYYKIEVKPNLPDALRGRLYNISVDLLPEFFEALPGTPLDPTGATFHNYKLSIPDIVIGFPYGPTSPWAGKVFTTWGRATSLQWYHLVERTHWKVLGAKTVSEDQIQELREISGVQSQEMRSLLNSFWDGLVDTSTNKNIPVTSTQYNTQYDRIDYDLSVLDSNGVEQFPVAVVPSAGPDVASVSFLVKTYAQELHNGWNLLSGNTWLTYKDPAPKTKTFSLGRSFSVRAYGAHLSVAYSAQLIEPNTLQIKDDQMVYSHEEGIARIYMSVINDGDDFAFQCDMTVYLARDLEVQMDKLTVPYTLTEEYEPNTNQLAHKLVLHTQATIEPGGILGYQIYVYYPPMETDDSTEFDPAMKREAPTERLFVCKSRGAVDLEDKNMVADVTRIEQDFNQQYWLPVSGEQGKKAVLTGDKTRSLKNVQVELTVELANFDGPAVYYEWWRNNLNFERDDMPSQAWYVFGDITSYETRLVDVGKIDGNQNYEADFMVIVRNATNGYIMATNVYQYRNAPEWWIVVLGCVGGAGLIAAFLLWLLAHKVKRRMQMDEKVNSQELAAVRTKRMQAVSVSEGQVSTLEEAPTQNAMKLGSYYRGGVSGAPARVNWGKAGATDSAPKEVVALSATGDVEADQLAPAVPGKGRHGPRPAYEETWQQKFVTTLTSVCCFCIVRSKGQEMRTNEDRRTANAPPRPAHRTLAAAAQPQVDKEEEEVVTVASTSARPPPPPPKARAAPPPPAPRATSPRAVPVAPAHAGPPVAPPPRRPPPPSARRV